VNSEAERRRLAASFDRVAELYDAARPRYPDAAIERILAASGIPDGGRILEICPGPGNAQVCALTMAQRRV
jgi:hypothetical protein